MSQKARVALFTLKEIKKYSAFAETKRFKIHISGNSWLDLSTCRIMCGLRNDRPAGKQLRPL